MARTLDPFQFLLVAVAGWMNRHQQQTIEYLREENRVLHEQLGDRRLRFDDDQRRRLAAKDKGLGRKLLAQAPHWLRLKLCWHGTANSAQRSTTDVTSAGQDALAPQVK